MGNDLLMARVDLTPMLDGHVGLLAFYNILHTIDIFSNSMPLINGTVPRAVLDLST